MDKYYKKYVLIWDGNFTTLVKKTYSISFCITCMNRLYNLKKALLCKRYNDYFKHVIYFLEHKEMIEIMSKNSIRIAQDFYTERVIGKLVKIIGG